MRNQGCGRADLTQGYSMNPNMGVFAQLMMAKTFAKKFEIFWLTTTSKI
jgi:hypothetical protein